MLLNLDIQIFIPDCFMHNLCIFLFQLTFSHWPTAGTCEHCLPGKELQSASHAQAEISSQFPPSHWLIGATLVQPFLANVCMLGLRCDCWRLLL